MQRALLNEQSSKVSPVKGAFVWKDLSFELEQLGFCKEPFSCSIFPRQ